MKPLLKRTLQGLAGLVGLGVAGIGFVLVYNRFDAPLTPQAQALLAAQPVPDKTPGNAYFMLLGLGAAKDKDAQAAGLALDQLYFKAFTETPMRSDVPDATAVLGPAAPAPAQPQESLRCNWAEKDCLAQFRSQRAAIEQLKTDQAFMAERYQRLLALPAFQDRALQSLYEPLPNFKPLLDLDAAAQAQALFDCEQGDTARALDHIASIATLARRAMANSVSLVNKLVFAQVLRNNLALLNALVREYPALLAPSPQLAALAAPLTPAELSLARSATSEAHAIAQAFMHIDTAFALATQSDPVAEGGPRLLRGLANLGYQPQATINLLAGRKPLFALDSHWLRHGAASADQADNDDWPTGAFWEDWVDNPVGRALLGAATPDMGAHTDRLLDTAGYQRLTALHLQIAAARVPDADIPALLQAQATQLGDPYGGQPVKPMQWDAATRTLWFQGHGATSSGPSKGRLSVAL